MESLTSLFKEYTLYTLEECIELLGWKYDFDSNSITNLTCDCGEKVRIGGILIPDHAWCPNCHKGIHDLSGIVPLSSCRCTMIPEEYIRNDDRTWVAINLWGF